MIMDRYCSPQTHQEKKAFITALLEDVAEGAEKNEVVAISNRGNIWYAAVQIAKANETTIRDYAVLLGMPCIIGAVVQTSVENGEFGYKIEEECCGPSYCTAPKRLIAQLSPLNGTGRYALDWRTQCLQQTPLRGRG